MSRNLKPMPNRPDPPRRSPSIAKNPSDRNSTFRSIKEFMSPRAPRTDQGPIPQCNPKRIIAPSSKPSSSKNKVKGKAKISDPCSRQPPITGFCQKLITSTFTQISQRASPPAGTPLDPGEESFQK